MKNYQKTALRFLLICSCGFGATAQVKVGLNPTTIDANANLQIEATDGSQVTVKKDNGRLGVGTLSPTEKLTVVGNGLFNNGTVNTQVGSASTGGFVGTTSNNPLDFLINNNPVVRLTDEDLSPDNNVGGGFRTLGNSTNRWGQLLSTFGIDAFSPLTSTVASRHRAGGGGVTVDSRIGSYTSQSVFPFLGNTMIVGTFTNHPINFIIGNSPAIRLNLSELIPHGNGSASLGSTTNNWSVVYAINGTIQTSDRRLKENIKPIAHGLSDVLKLEAVSFDWRDKSNERTKLGFIAQDLQKILPELVNGRESKDTYLGVNYAELTPVLVKAIQEQQAMIEALKSKLAESNSEMASIKGLLNNMEAGKASK